jgi:hypothetical protein
MEHEQLDEKQLVLANVSGKSAERWMQFRNKLVQTLQDFLDTVLDTEQGTTIRDEAQQFTKALLDYAKAHLARPGLENDKLEAEIRRLFSQSEADRAEARKKNAEAEAIEFQTKVKRLRLVLGGTKAMLIGERGEEAVIFAQQIEEFLQTLKELTAG